jgi:tetratricopeptide (TPR) repeat protein
VFTVLLFFLWAELSAQTINDGIALIDQAKFTEAKLLFEQILKDDDKNAEAHYQLGLILYNHNYKDRNVDEAVDHLEEAVDLNPKNADYQFLYGAAIGEKTQHAGIFKKAFLAPKIKEAFARAVELNPKLVLARYGLAQYYLMAPSIMGGDEEKGWKEIDEIIKLDEVMGRSLKATMLARAQKKNYGYFQLRNEKADEATKYFEKYVELRPDTADSYQSLAEALLKSSELDQAMINLKKSLSIDKNFVPAIISLGEVYQAKGQKKEAKETYQWAISIAQNDHYKRQAEKKLKEVE